MSVGPSSNAEPGWFREISLTILAATAVVGLLTAIAMIILGSDQATNHFEHHTSTAVTSVSLIGSCTPSHPAAVVADIYPGSLLVTNADQDTPLTRLLLSEPASPASTTTDSCQPSAAN